MSIEQEAPKVISNLSDSGLGYLWLLGLAIWGGSANYISRIKRNRTPFSIIELIGEWTISGFAGVITAYVCYHLKWDWYLTAAATGISGHMGGRAIYILETIAIKYRFGNKESDGH